MKNRLQQTTVLIGLALALPAAADVIYSNFLDTAIPTDYDGVTITVDGGTINPFFGGVGVANDANLQPFRDGTDGLDTILNLALGSTINAGSAFLSSGAGGSQDHLGSTFTAGEEGYIGFKLNDSDYGWMRVGFTDNTGGAVVKDWAYENSGSAITVGGIRQVGQDLIVSSGFTLGSALADSGAATNLVKNSIGTNTLTATSTYSGSTNITAGTLAVGGSGSINNSSGVTLNGGTLRYNSSVALTIPVIYTSGTVGGTNLTGTLGGLAIGSGQTLSPGNSPGTADTTSQTWADGGTYLMEINNATGTAGSDPGWDLVSGSGALNISANSGSPFVIDVTSLGLDNQVGEAINFNSLASYAWIIADFNSITNFAAEAFSVDTSNFSNTFEGTFGVAQGGGLIAGDASQIYLSYTAVPEPRAALLAALGALALLLPRRRSCS